MDVNLLMELCLFLFMKSQFIDSGLVKNADGSSMGNCVQLCHCFIGLAHLRSNYSVCGPLAKMSLTTIT